MKIAVCGKGGSGKSTITALLAKNLSKKGYRVIVVDVDESNYGLHGLLGMDMPEDIMDFFGGKSGYGKKMQSMRENKDTCVFDERWEVDKIPPEFVLKKDGIWLAVTGKIKGFGEGCACAMGSLSKQFLENLILKEDDIVIVDTEAGIEHLGRAIARGFDALLIIVDPSLESIRLSSKIEEIATGNVGRTYVVLNKVEDGMLELMAEALGQGRIAATIPANGALFKASLCGKELTTDIKEIDELVNLLTSGL